MTLQSPLEGTTDYRTSDRTRIVLALADLRCEWQRAVKGGKGAKENVPTALYRLLPPFSPYQRPPHRLLPLQRIPSGKTRGTHGGARGHHGITAHAGFL